jgi:NADH dehydrogenase
LGSQAEYFNIEGLKEHGLSLKTLEDAVRIKNRIKTLYEKKVKNGEDLKIVVGGGGFSGTEYTAELVKFKEKLTNKNKDLENLIEISVIQGSECLLKELDPNVSKIAQGKLRKNGVKFCFGTHIQRVTGDEVKTEDGKIYKYDILIWTGGVRANDILLKSGFSTNYKGQVQVDDFLRVLGSKNIFAVGDAAEYADPQTNKPAPSVAQVAEDQGKVAAENILRSIDSKALKKYEYRHFGYIIPLEGHFAVAALGKYTIVGFFGWVVQQIVFLRYLLGILPVLKAFKRFDKFEEYLLSK